MKESRISVASLVACMLLFYSSISLAAPFGRLSVLTSVQTRGSAPLVMDLRPSLTSPQQIEGTLNGDFIDGIFTSATREIVLIRTSRIDGYPVQAFVGTYSQHRNRLGESLEIRGTVLALSREGGADSTRNVFGFRAWSGAVAQTIPPQPVAAPSTTGASSVRPWGAWRALVNQQQLAMVIEYRNDGLLSGRMQGDWIRGHFAFESGTFAFLRFVADKPTQLYFGEARVGRLLNVAPFVEFELQGSLIALTAAGGASSEQNRYPFSAANQQNFEAMLVTRNDCLASFRSVIRLMNCGAPQTYQEFAFLSDSSNTVLVNRATGLCLDVPDGVTGERIQQFPCHWRPNQRASRQAISPSRCQLEGCFAIFLNGGCLKLSHHSIYDTPRRLVTSNDCSSGLEDAVLEFRMEPSINPMN